MEKYKKMRKILSVFCLVLILIGLLAVSYFLFFINLSKEQVSIIIPSLENVEISKEREKGRTIIHIDYSCSSDEECYLTSTNCCPESAGAVWECIGKKSVIECNVEGVLCPQVISPKPSVNCRCVNGFCIPQ